MPIKLYCLIFLIATTLASNRIQAGSASDIEWRHYAADLSSTRYSPADQINASNFDKLEIAWRFKTDNLGTKPEYKLEGTPVMVNGVLYTTAGTRRAVIALRAETGELLWTHSEFEGQRAVVAPRQLSGRGLAYWSDTKEERILYMTPGYKLVALDAKTGMRISSFGDDGLVDLKVGVTHGTGQQIELDGSKHDIGIHSTPIVVKDIVIVGSAMKEGFTPRTHDNSKGLVRAYDVRSGKLLWTFHTIPRPGEFGHDTWLNDSWAKNGNTGVWTQISVDEELGLVYLPVESPTSDFYGGHRPGDNLFGESLVCVDLNTGKRKWHFQIVHHPLWDYDLSSAPILADVKIRGKMRKVVALPTKEAFLYVFDRVTGEPIWEIQEKPVPQGDVPGEWYSKTQPFPTKPPPYARQSIKPEDLIDFTPELRKQALEVIKPFKLGPMFSPPIVSGTDGKVAQLTIGITTGGTNWPGAAYDPETRIVYAPASNHNVFPVAVIEPPASFATDMKYVFGRVDLPFIESEGPGFGSAADAPKTRVVPVPIPPPNFARTTVDGLPLLKPPYGMLNAIHLETGTILWQVPHGETPDVVREHAALKDKKIPRTGQSGAVGALVTKTLVVMGDPQVTTTPERPRGAMLRAYDKKTGKEVGAIWMPAQQSGSPMTYVVNGKQFIVVAVSGGNYSGEYIAFALGEDAAKVEKKESFGDVVGQAKKEMPAKKNTTPRKSLYTQQQAQRGAELYRQRCSSCHGAEMAGGEEATALVGGAFQAAWGGLSVGDLMERTRATMPPPPHPRNLRREDYAAIIAHILKSNGYPAGDKELPSKTGELHFLKIEK